MSDSLPTASCRTEAREELRRQVGTLRFDLSSLAAGLDKPKRKEAARLQKDFFNKVSSSPAPLQVPENHHSVPLPESPAKQLGLCRSTAPA